MKTKELITLSFLGALLLVLQVALAPLPNVEVVSLLITLYTLHYRSKVLYIIYLFALLEGCIYGFGIWWLNYLYVWTVLWAITMAFSKNRSMVFWAVIQGFFGLCFGALCAIPYALAGGWYAGFSYWVSGIPFDLIHCVSNVVVTLVLYKPLKYCLDYIHKKLANY